MMESQGVPAAENARATSGLMPGEPEWQVGEMGLGYHQARRMFVLVASQAAARDEEPSTDDAPSVRLWLSHDQDVAFSKQAETVLTAAPPPPPPPCLPRGPPA